MLKTETIRKIFSNLIISTVISVASYIIYTSLYSDVPFIPSKPNSINKQRRYKIVLEEDTREDFLIEVFLGSYVHDVINIFLSYNFNS